MKTWVWCHQGLEGGTSTISLLLGYPTSKASSETLNLKSSKAAIERYSLKLQAVLVDAGTSIAKLWAINSSLRPSKIPEEASLNLKEKVAAVETVHLSPTE